MSKLIDIEYIANKMPYGIIPIRTKRIILRMFCTSITKSMRDHFEYHFEQFKIKPLKKYTLRKNEKAERFLFKQ